MPKGSNIVNLIGLKFGSLTVIDREPNHITPSGRKILRWKCVCDCGNIVVKNGEQLKRMVGVCCSECFKKKQSPKIIDLTGQQFGELTVINMTEPLVMPCGRKQIKWHCICSCGNYTDVLSTHLIRGKTISCGCQQGKRETTPNRYEDKESYYIGYTFDEREFYVDKEDFDKIKDYRWHIDSAGYVASVINKKIIRMHRLIIDTEYEHIDHIHGRDTRNDNRRSNLRPCTHSENLCNRGLDTNNTTGAKGVYKTKSGRYAAAITKDGQQFHLGTFDTIKEAADAYDKMAINLHGEFAFLNNYDENREQGAIND